jgi:hypothetical protein
MHKHIIAVLAILAIASCSSKPEKKVVVKPTVTKPKQVKNVVMYLRNNNHRLKDVGGLIEERLSILAERYKKTVAGMTSSPEWRVAWNKDESQKPQPTDAYFVYDVREVRPSMGEWFFSFLCIPCKDGQVVDIYCPEVSVVVTSRSLQEVFEIYAIVTQSVFNLEALAFNLDKSDITCIYTSKYHLVEGVVKK